MALGKQFAGKYFEVSTREDGVIEFRPMAVIPESQAWAHTPEMKKRLDESEKWMAENPARTDNAMLILDSMETAIDAPKTHHARHAERAKPAIAATRRA